MKKPFIYAAVAGIYIIFIVNLINTFAVIFPGPDKKTILIPIVMLGLFVLSAAVMGFLFLYEPFELYMQNKKQEALSFFGKTLGIFACFVAIFVILLFLK
jgi:small-conductance mechanosensitive channel